MPKLAQHYKAVVTAAVTVNSTKARSSFVKDAISHDFLEAQAALELALKDLDNDSHREFADFLLNLTVEKAPRHTRRVVIWNTNNEDGIAMLLVGYCPQELAYYLGLAREFLKTFPDANVGAMGCHQITRSHNVKGFTLAILPIKGPKRDIPGYDVWSGIDFNY